MGRRKTTSDDRTDHFERNDLPKTDGANLRIVQKATVRSTFRNSNSSMNRTLILYPLDIKCIAFNINETFIFSISYPTITKRKVIPRKDIILSAFTD